MGEEDYHLLCADLLTGAVRDLAPFAGARCELVAVDRHEPVAIVGLNNRDPRVFDLHRVDLDDGTCTMVVENPGIEDWLVGPDLSLRGGLRMRDDGRVEALAFVDGDWRVVNEYVGDYLAVLPLGVTPDDEVILRTDVLGDTRAIARLDLSAGAIAEEFRHPTYDVQSAVLHPETRRPQFVTVEGHRPADVVLDPAVAADWEALGRQHAGRPVVVSRDRADCEWIVGYLSDAGPVAHYRWDRQTRTAEFLFDHRPAMHDYQWAPMEPFSYKARDGLPIEGYLSYPPHLPRHSLPAVVNVHGGPWRQDDLVDAIDHLAGLGVVDAHRVGIIGVSYGGYATLAAVTFTDRFRCGVARVGPANLVSFIESLPSYWQPTVDLWHRRVGHPVHDRALLESWSPLFHADRIEHPLLIVHGARDPRVPKAESDALVAELSRRGVEHEYLVFDDEGHGINRAENRLTFYERAERFLARHLG